MKINPVGPSGNDIVIYYNYLIQHTERICAINEFLSEFVMRREGRGYISGYIILLVARDFIPDQELFTFPPIPPSGLQPQKSDAFYIEFP